MAQANMRLRFEMKLESPFLATIRPLEATMKKTLGITAALLCLGAGLASAQINLSWTDCGAFGAPNKANLCTSNSGTHQLISTFIAPANVTAATGGDLVMDMQSSEPTLPDWWNFGGCRAAAALVFSSDFSAVPGSGNCGEFFGSALGGGFNFPSFGGANRQRFKHGFALASGFPAIPAATEVYFSRIQFSNIGTVGGCAGCLFPACIVLNQINVTQDPVSHPGGNFSFTLAAVRQHVTWQGGGGVDCPGVTPARKTSWGTIKTLYR
jgi:hypothetical protein